MVGAAARGHRGPQHGLLVLVVDDNEDAREMYRMYFEHAGQRIITAKDGRDATRKTRRQKPDVIVMDLSMPVMDGWEAARWLKHEPQSADVPIIALTGRAIRTPKDLDRERDFDRYVTKPCLPDDLLMIVRDVIDEHGRRRRRI